MKKLKYYVVLSVVLLFTLMLSSQMALIAAGGVNINEIRIDQGGSDNDEYFELAGPPGMSLGGLTYLVIGDGTGGSGVVEAVVDLSGQSISADGFFVVAESTFTLGSAELTLPGSNPLNFENSDNVTHLLVDGFTGSNGDDLDTNDDGILDVTPWTSIVDSVALIETVGSGDQVYSLNTVGPDGSFVPAQVFFCPGTPPNGWVIGSFSLDGGTDTPGDANSNCPPPPLSLTIPEIQGAGHISPFDGDLVTTTGIVTAIAFNGFYLQDATGDGSDDTADGIFVSGNTSAVSVGDEAEVTALVDEDIPGGAATGNLSTTRLNPLVVLVLSSGNALPTPVIIGSGGRVPPAVDVISSGEEPVNLQNDPGTFNPADDGIDFYESLEGMLVTIEDPVAVSATRTFNSFSSELFTLTNNGAHIAPGDARTARGGINLQPDPDNTGDQNPERVQIQLDGTLFPFPVPAITVGDRLGDVTGVMGYSFGNFEVNALSTFSVTPSGLGLETTSLVGTDNQVTVASYNVLNLDATSADDNQRATLASHIVNNLGAPDVIAVQEIQDNNGETDDGTTDATQTLQKLVDAISTAGGPTYSFFDVVPADGTSGGAPGGNIRNAFLYNDTRVTLNDFKSLTPKHLSKAGVGNPNAFAGTRNPLEAVFEFNGKEFAVINNHLTSRFGSTPVFGGPQPFVQAGETEREAQMQALNDYVDDYLAKPGERRVIVVGDLNTMEFTDDLTEILPGTGSDKVLTNLTDSLTDDNVYTFNFEGNSQVLDGYFVSDSLLAGAEFDIVHVNVDFPRVNDSVGSDHEPLVGRLTISADED